MPPSKHGALRNGNITWKMEISYLLFLMEEEIYAEKRVIFGSSEA
jgi:hypothetical protein